MSTEEYLAIEGNSLIEDGSETLLRQVHPSQIIDSKPTSQAFEATEAHRFLLSTKRESFGAQEAYEAHIARGLESDGTWGVTVDAAKEAGTPPIDDAQHVGEDSHASLSFLDHASRGKRTQSARKLRNAATCLYPAPVETPKPTQD